MLPVASCLLSLQQKSAISGQTPQFPSPLVLLTPAVIKQHLCLPLKLLSGFQPLKHSITNLIILENKNILEFKGYRDFSNYFLKWLLRFESSSVRTRVACVVCLQRYRGRQMEVVVLTREKETWGNFPFSWPPDVSSATSVNSSNWGHIVALKNKK